MEYSLLEMIVKYLSFVDQNATDILRLNIILKKLNGLKLTEKLMVKN